MLSAAIGCEMNPGITLHRISQEGYTSSDLSGYYSGSYILHKSEEGLEPVYVRGVYDDGVFSVDHLDNDGDLQDIHVDMDNCYRMCIPSGYYGIRGTLCRFSYRAARSYKKGLSADFIHITPLPRGGLLRALYALVYPQDLEGVEFISRKLVIKDGRIHTHYRELSVGRDRDGEIDTPFPAVKQRIEETRNAQL